jgi:hypothetical protein
MLTFRPARIVSVGGTAWLESFGPVRSQISEMARKTRNKHEDTRRMDIGPSFCYGAERRAKLQIRLSYRA